MEKKEFPREKTCGDGLTPRAVRQLADMGVEDAHGRRPPLPGPALGRLRPDHRARVARGARASPRYGYTITRHDLDALVADRAAKAGATVHQGAEALEPLEPATAGATGALGGCAGASASRSTRTLDPAEIRARYVVVADGANSRFGRALGTARDRAYPQGMALRGYYRSERHDDDMIESHLDIRDANGDVVPGYGWIFPLGDGRVNVGVGLLSTEQRWKGLNTARLMDAFVDQAPASWGIRPETACGPADRRPPPDGHGGRAPGRAQHRRGRRRRRPHQPVQRRGHRLRLRDRAAGGGVPGRGPAGGGPGSLAAYEQRLDDAYGDYYRVGRAFVRLISDPDRMRRCVVTRHALADLHGPAHADHGQPHAAPDHRPGRGRLTGRWSARRTCSSAWAVGASA